MKLKLADLHIQRNYNIRNHIANVNTNRTNRMLFEEKSDSKETV